MLGWLLTPVVIFAAAALSGCGEQSSTAAGEPGRPSAHSAVAYRAIAHSTQNPTTTGTVALARTRIPTFPVVTPSGGVGAAWRPVARLGGRVAAWEAERSGVTLLRFDQSLTGLTLHAGLGEPGGSWRYGDRIGPSEVHRVIAAFNGGFKFETGAVGYLAEGRMASPLQAGRGSIVIYRDGTTQIGRWGAGVPAHGQPIASVLQNLSLLVDRGRAARSVEGCIQSCWGATVGGVDATARSALGIDGAGRLVWAAGENLLPSDLARALIAAGAQRAVELDINPDWVAGYLYVHGGGGPRAEPVVPGQLGISGRFLAPYSRDFFTLLARWPR